MTNPPPWPQAPVPMNPNKTNGLAIAALCTGIGSVVLCWLGILGMIAGVLGIVFGLMGMKQTQERGEGGRSLALTGLITGIVGTVLSLVDIIIGIAAFNS